MQLSCSVSKMDDGSILVEIYGQDWRIGLCLDKIPADSGWWLVSKHNGLDTAGDIVNSTEFYNKLSKLLER